MEDSAKKTKIKSGWMSFSPYELAFLKLIKELSRSNPSNSIQRLDFASEILFSLQLATVILFFGIDIDGYSTFEDLVSAICIMRLDYLAVKYSFLSLFLSIGYVLLISLLLSAVILYLQIFFKRFFIYSFFRYSLIIALGIYHYILKLPMLVLLFLLVSRPSEGKIDDFYRVKDTHFKNLEHISNLPGILLIFAINLICQTRALSNKMITDKFGKRNSLNMDRKEEFATVLILFFCVFLNRSSFTYIMTGSVALYMLKNFYKFLPSHSYNENLVKLARYLLIITLCVSYYVGFLVTEPALMFLNIVFVFPLLVFITKVKVDSRIKKFKEEISLDPLDMDLCVRTNEKLRNFQDFQNFIKNMYGDLGEDFKLGLLESKYFYQVFKKNEISLLKISKLLYFENLQKKNILLQLEIKYQTYCFFNYLITKTKLKEPQLVKMGLDIKQIKENDLDLCRQSIRYLEQISHKNKFCGFHFFKLSHNLMEKLKSVRLKYKNLIKKYPGEREFSHLFESLQDIFERADISTNINRSGLRNSTLKSFQKSRNQTDPRIVINGDPKNLGKVIYMSSRARKILKYQTECKHIKHLIPATSKAAVNDFFKNLFFMSEQVHYKYPYFCLQKKDGIIILVKLSLSLTWYKFSPYFIINFKKHSKNVNSYIYDKFGAILAHSRSTTIEDENPGNIRNLGLSLLNDYEPSMIENNNDISCCLKFKLPVYQDEVYILLLFNDITVLEDMANHYEAIRTYYLPKFTACAEKLSSLFQKNKFLFDSHLRRSMDIEVHSAEEANNEKLTISSAIKQKQEYLNVVKKAISLYTSPIRIGTKVVMVGYICSSLIVIFVTYFGIQEIVSNIAIDELGSMRSMTQTISSSTRALQLMNNGYEMEYTEEHYRSSLETSSTNLKSMIKRFQDGVAIDLLLKKPLFTQNIVHVHDIIEGEIFESDLYLSESLRLLSDKAIAINNRPVQDPSDYYYILQNGPINILKSLNSTVYQALELTLERVDLLESLYTVLCALIFIPSLIFLVVAALAIKYLENINKQFLKYYAKTKDLMICEIGNIIQERILIEFDVEEKGEYGPKPRLKEISMWTLWRVTIGLIILASGVSYFMITIIYPNQIFLMIRQQPNHDFWYGFSRLIPIRSYYWTRETYLDFESSNSYEKLFWNYSLIPDMLKMSIDVAEEFHHEINNIRFMIKDSYTSTIEDYNTIMYGRACEVLKEILPNCEKSIIARGLSLGVIEYINIIKGLSYMSERGEVNWVTVKELEKKSEYLRIAASESMTVVTNSSEEILYKLITNQITLSTFIFFVLGVFIVFMIHWGLLRIADQFISKIKITGVIDDNVLRSLAKSLNK